MSFDTALAHKLAAWNERRLVRDISLWVYVLLVSEGSYTRKVLSGFYSGLGTGYLPAFYDVYFLYKMVKVMPDMDTLQKRLGKIQSRIPKFRTVKKMSLSIFLDNLRKYIELLDEKIIIEQLSPLMNKDDLSGLELKIRTAVNELIEKLSD